jgi:hypothetical protein
MGDLPMIGLMEWLGRYLAIGFSNDADGMNIPSGSEYRALHEAPPTDPPNANSD